MVTAREPAAACWLINDVTSCSDMSLKSSYQNLSARTSRRYSRQTTSSTHSRTASADLASATGTANARRATELQGACSGLNAEGAHECVVNKHNCPSRDGEPPSFRVVAIQPLAYIVAGVLDSRFELV
jgi:hypothetical protein